MSSRGDMILALTAAFALHGAALLSIDLPASGAASGAGGEASITIAAAVPELRAVVETWETPPAVVDEVKPAPSPEAEALPKPAGAWDDHQVRDISPGSLDNPVLIVAPTTASVAAALSNAPLVETSEKLASAAVDSVPKRIELPKPFEETPDKRPGVFVSPERPDRALATSKRPAARPSKNGSDEAIAGRVAEGAGGSVTRGTSSEVVAAVAVSPSAVKAAQAAWAAAIQSRIARHQRFPRRARGNGRVRLTMIIQADGRLTDVDVAESSGALAFDRAAVAAAKKAAPFPAAPKALSEPWYKVGQWVNFGQ